MLSLWDNAVRRSTGVSRQEWDGETRSKLPQRCACPGEGKWQGHLQKRHPPEGIKLVPVHPELPWISLSPPTEV